MRHTAIASIILLGQTLASGGVGAVPASPPGGPAPAEVSLSSANTPRAVTVARTTIIPSCTVFVDGASKAGGDGTAQKPHKTLAAAVEAADSGAVICVAEGTYSEQLKPGEKYFTLAGGFARGKAFKIRDSSAYATRAKGSGGSFLRSEDPGPKDGLTAIDGFDISGYSQAIYRDIYYTQRFDITNNFIHDNACGDNALAGAAFALNNISGTISGNVIANNSCGRGGGGFINDDSNKNSVRIENNLIEGNSGIEPDASHGGALYLFVNKLAITGNAFVGNTVTRWGAGLFIGAFNDGGQFTSAKLAWNVYRGNRAGIAGGGSFCDESASCESDHEVYQANCGGNIYLDSGPGTAGGTKAKFDHLTNVGALDAECKGPGDGIRIDKDGDGPDSYAVTNAIFWGNAPGRDIAATCMSSCKAIKVNVTHSMVQPAHQDAMTVTYGAGIMAPVDPQFVAAENGDFRLRATSPVIGKGAYGKSGEPSNASPKEESRSAPAIHAEKSGGAAAAPVIVEKPAVVVAQNSARGQASDISAKEAFEAAKELGTAEAWEAFLASYPAGFYADLARAYMKKLGAVAPPSPAPAPAAKQEADPKPQLAKSAAAAGRAPQSEAGKPAVTRGGEYMSFPEKFNRYYTDPAWTPSKTVYVGPSGNGDGATPDTPMPVQAAVAAATPGTRIHFLRGKYQGCLEFTKENSGSYDEPVVLYAERNPDKSIGVAMSCCKTGRQTCVNFEDADHIAIDGFELIGGKYGVRAAGAGYPASQHSSGIAVLNNKAHDQSRDGFLSGQADWAVWEGNVAYNAQVDDGHGIYLSNGGDWNIVRFNETYSNLSSDFQINADPNSTCKAVGIPFDDPRCDAYAGEGEGGQGASDYFLVDGNYFHHGKATGPNFTSVRRSVIRNNIFGPQVRHNVSFWQETDNPKLGSSDNQILHNLFITTGRHGIQFANNSTRNVFANNVLVGVQVKGGAVTANPSALLMEVDDTVGDNEYRANFYVSGKLEGRSPNDQETAREDFSPNWFKAFPAALNHDPNDLMPTALAPFLGLGALAVDGASDRNGTIRSGKVDLGPIERP